jgi:hypothetical protein
MGKPINIQEIMNLIPLIPIGTKLHLRQDAIPAAKLRDFRFKGAGEKGKVILAPEMGTYEWQAKIEYVDWEKYLEENPSG